MYVRLTETDFDYLSTKNKKKIISHKMRTVIELYEQNGDSITNIRVDFTQILIRKLQVHSNRKNANLIM